MIELLLDWLARYGYPVVFTAATLENVFPLGFLVPGEIVVLSAAAASGPAALDPVVVAALAAAGETLGELVSYVLGRVAGARIILAVSRRVPRLAGPLEAASEYFRVRGSWAIVLGRPAWGVKAALPVIAGAAGMPAWKAVLLVSVSSLYYYPILVMLAYYFGISVTESTTRTVSIALAVVFLLLVTVWRIRTMRRHRT